MATNNKWCHLSLEVTSSLFYGLLVDSFGAASLIVSSSWWKEVSFPKSCSYFFQNFLLVKPALSFGWYSLKSSGPSFNTTLCPRLMTNYLSFQSISILTPRSRMNKGIHNTLALDSPTTRHEPPTTLEFYIFFLDINRLFNIQNILKCLRIFHQR